MKELKFAPNQEKALNAFADASDALFNLDIISTDSFTGEIGEYIACQLLELTKMPRVTTHIDAISKSREKYQIKSKVISDENYGYSISKLSQNDFNYLVVVYFDKLYNVINVLKIPSNIISDGKIRINNEMSKKHIIDISKFKLAKQNSEAISLFGETYSELENLQIIRSRKIVGDIGEYYACKRLNIQRCEDVNKKGIDATSLDGLTFEIKTRRVYESGRRNSNKSTRRLNNLVGKDANYLIIVTLDRVFRCSGMWIMPMKDVVNPKSANLNIVNNATCNVMNLMPSRIEWLNSRVPFKAFK